MKQIVYYFSEKLQTGQKHSNNNQKIKQKSYHYHATTFITKFKQEIVN